MVKFSEGKRRYESVSGWQFGQFPRLEISQELIMVSVILSKIVA